MKRRSFLAASAGALFAPSISFGATQELRIYYPYAPQGSTWNVLASNAEAIFRKHFENQITVKSFYRGELKIGANYDIKNPVEAVENGLVDIALIANEQHFNEVSSSLTNGFYASLFLDQTLRTVDHIDAFVRDGDAWGILNEILSDQNATFAPIGTAGKTGLGWFHGDTHEIFSQARDAHISKADAPVMLTDYGWYNFWDDAGFMPINLDEALQYSAKNTNTIPGVDPQGRNFDWLRCHGDASKVPSCRQIVGAQVASETSADRMGAVEIWDSYVLPEAFGAPSMQYIALDQKRAFDEVAFYGRIFRDAMKTTRQDLESSRQPRLDFAQDVGVKMIKTPEEFSATGAMYYMAEAARKKAIDRNERYMDAIVRNTAEFFKTRQKYAT